LAASNSSQRSTSGPCRDSRPGLRLPSEECTVMSSPTNRAALRDEVNLQLEAEVKAVLDGAVTIAESTTEPFQT
jgi:hypothetical protein